MRSRGVAAFAISIGLGTLSGSATALAAPEVEAGALRAEVGSGSWQLRLTDRTGRTTLEQLTGPGTAGAGARALGFRTAAGWQHATEIADARSRHGAYTATLATTDPQHSFEVRLEPAGKGVIAMRARLIGSLDDVEALGIGFAARADERYLGFGERSNAVDQRGNVVENYVADGPYQDLEYPAINLFTPAWGLRDGHSEATYFPVPWLLSTAGYGVLVDNPETSVFRLASDGADAWSAEVLAGPAGESGAGAGGPPSELSLRFFAGPTPADALRRFTRATGRQPAPPAPWALGTWYQADDDELSEIALLRAADAPLSVLQTYVHYLPCAEQAGTDQGARTAAAHGAGVAITTYFNPMVCTSYSDAFERAAAAGALTATSSGEPYLYRYGTDLDASFWVAQYDFFTEAGRTEYARVLDAAVGDGYDGWMEDFGEYTPLDSVSAGAIPGTRAHNPYPTRYHCAAHEATSTGPRPIVRFQRSGWTGSAACATVVWGGDPTTSWGFDGLRSAVTQALSAGTSGVAIWGSDIGGFFALGPNRLTPELLTRWVQLGAVSPVMRTQANGVAVPRSDRPQVSDPDQIANWRRYTKLHTQLYPYLDAAVADYRRTGIPVMRHLGLVYPRDSRAVAVEDEFLFGPDLLAAPVLDPEQVQRSAYLPRGRWIDLWRSAAYRETSGGLRLGKASVLRGRRDLTVPAPLTELPLFVRRGAVIAMLPARVDTLAGYGNGVEGIQTLAANRRHAELLAFPRGRSRAAFYSSETIRSIEHRGRWQLRIAGKMRRGYDLQASMKTLRRPLRPCRLEVDGRELAARRWRFERSTGVLRARFAGRRPTLTAIGC